MVDQIKNKEIYKNHHQIIKKKYWKMKVPQSNQKPKIQTLHHQNHILKNKVVKIKKNIPSLIKMEKK